MDKFGKIDRNVIKKFNINDKKNDFRFWQSQPFEYRLERLENIREEFNSGNMVHKKDFREFIQLLNEHNA